MKKTSLNSISKQLKQASTYAKGVHSSMSRGSDKSDADDMDRNTHNSQIKNSTSKASYQSAYSMRKNSSGLQSGEKSKRKSVYPGTKPVSGCKILGSTPKIDRQSEYTFISPKGKATVNIFNFNNYNIIKSEKEKFQAEPIKESSVDKSIHSSDNHHNFFMFSRRKNSQKLKSCNSRKSLSKGSVENQKLPKSGSNIAKVLWSNRNEPSLANHVKKKSLNIPSADRRRLMSSTSFHRSVASNGSYISTDQKSRNTSNPNAAMDPTSFDDMNIFLKYVQHHNKMLQWLNSVRSAQKSIRSIPKQNKSSVSLLKRRSSIVDPSQEPLSETRDLICTLIGELQSLEATKLKSAEKISTSTETKEKMPQTTDPVLSGTNFTTLIKESAQSILFQSARLCRKEADASQFFKLSGVRPWMDPQSTKLFNSSISTIQEHLIFEEALKMMQEQDLGLEGIFSLAYRNLGVIANNTTIGSQVDIGEDGMEASAASFDDRDGHRDVRGCVGQTAENVYELDFDRLKYESSVENSDFD